LVFIVISNALLMALDGDTLSDSVKRDVVPNLNIFFNAVFILEFFVKNLGLGPMSIVL